MQDRERTTPNRELFHGSSTISFADVAHQTLLFDQKNETDHLILQLIDTRWIQRLRNISQTGNTNLVYMFAEHSRFGHSLGVAYLASLLMKQLNTHSPEMVEPYQNAVAAAALLHDIGHVAPGSHLAEKIWAPSHSNLHERVGLRVIEEDRDIRRILAACHPQLIEQVLAILGESDSVPPWTHSVISGGGWNADRGNWAIVDSTMCSVSYGRYNVIALIDAFRLSRAGELVLRENRLDALTHFFVARDSMYRQVYQHRVLQAVDSLTGNIIRRLRDLLLSSICSEDQEEETARKQLSSRGIFCDESMISALLSKDYASQLPLTTIAQMTENWWDYHLEQWCASQDSILSDLSLRLRDRRLFKTIRLETSPNSTINDNSTDLVAQATHLCHSLGYDPKYYVNLIEETDKHRGRSEQAPMVALENGQIVPVTQIEPMIDQIIKRPPTKRIWLAVPLEIKQALKDKLSPS